MKNTVAFIIVLLLIAIAGVCWEFYEFQSARGMKTSETITLFKSYLSGVVAEMRARKPKPPPENPVIEKEMPKPAPEQTPEKPEPEEKPVIAPEVKVVITPTVKTPAKPIQVAPPVKPEPEKPKVKPEARETVMEGNRHYDQGVIHLQNTFKKDETFDKENERAMEKFRQAMAKYLEAERIDPDSLWLRNRIRETNSNIITCRRQARRK